MRRTAPVALLVSLVLSLSGLPADARRGPSIFYRRDTAVPSFVRHVDAPARSGSPASVALAHLAGNPARYRIEAPTNNLSLLDVHRGPGTAAVRFGQSYRGVPVWGAQYIVHLERSHGGLAPRTANGHVFTGLSTPVVPAFSVASARDLARLRARIIQIDRILEHGLVVLPPAPGVLAYHFTLRGSSFGRPVSLEMFVNARTGTLAMAYNGLQFDGAVNATGRTSHGDTVRFGAFERDGTFELRDQSKQMFDVHGGEITTHDANGTGRYLATDANLVESPDRTFDGGHTRSGAVDAHYGASVTYDYFLELGRDSLDGQGIDIRSTVDVTQGGLPLYNAAWDGIAKQMIYGNPDPSAFHPFSAALDVVGHELTHGVTQHSGNLAYVGQSGAMNEAYSDYFGNAIEVETLKTPMDSEEAGYIGENLCKVAHPSVFDCPLRDLNDEATTDDYIYFLADVDNGGLHINSTIFSGAMWDIRESIGSDADRYIYRALEAYVTPLDDFVDGRNAILAAAAELGATEEQKTAIAAAFDAHGITEGWDADSGNDATILMQDVAPISDLGIPSSPALSGTRYVVGDYADKSQMCCVGLQVFSGTINGLAAEQVSKGAPSSRYSDELPDVSGKRVVWGRVHVRKGSRIVGAEILTKVIGGPQKSLSDADPFDFNPAIDGSLVVWESGKRNIDIKGRYLGRRIFTVAKGSAPQVFPDVAGRWVAWWDLQRAAIGLKNLDTGKTRILRARGLFGITGPPTLSRKYLSWFEFDGFDPTGSIVRMDLATGKKKTVVPKSSGAAPVWWLQGVTLPPVVSSNDTYFAYSSEREYESLVDESEGDIPNDQIGRDIFIVPVNGGAPLQVTANRGDQAFPLLASGRRVIWLDSSQGRTDLVTRVVP